MASNLEAITPISSSDLGASTTATSSAAACSASPPPEASPRQGAQESGERIHGVVSGATGSATGV